MSATGRKTILGAFAAAAALVLTASLAWACTATHTNANPWFCRTGVQSCAFATRIGTSTLIATKNESFYSMLGGNQGGTNNDTVSANQNFTLRWVTGDRSALTDNGCNQTTESAAFKANGSDATFTTGTTGSWSGKGPVSMPNVPAGSYTICAVPSNALLSSSNHFYPFVLT
jgi:hypothetical protein